MLLLISSLSGWAFSVLSCFCRWYLWELFFFFFDGVYVFTGDKYVHKINVALIWRHRGSACAFHFIAEQSNSKVPVPPPPKKKKHSILIDKTLSLFCCGVVLIVFCICLLSQVCLYTAQESTPCHPNNPVTTGNGQVPKPSVCGTLALRLLLRLVSDWISSLVRLQLLQSTFYTAVP